jgi:hypothetical protein
VSDLDDDEPQLGQLLVSGTGGERVRHAFLLRTGVTMNDDWVALLRVEIERLPHIAVQVRDAVGGLHDECLGHLPADLIQPGQIALLKLQDFLAGGVAEVAYRGGVHARPVVHQELPRGR